ncbi:hypothetical protein PS15p_205689 [Mucor circinelloides]
MIGPAIPEALLKQKQNQDEIDISLSDDEQDQIEQQQAGPQIPLHLIEKKRQSNVNEESIGPQIPQHLLEQKRPTANVDEITISDNEEEEQVAGPQIPEHLLQQKRSIVNEDEIATSGNKEEEQVAGPQIPHNILDKKRAASTPKKQDEEEDPDVFAPALPPDLLEQRQKQQAYPQQEQENQRSGGRRRRPVGPSFPSGPMPMPNTEEDDFIVGPALPKDYNPEEEAKYSAIQAIEERARLTKEAMEQKKAGKTKVERPEWMLVPPEVDYLKKAGSGKSRQFTNKTMAPEDLDPSGWTETPAEKQRRLEEQRLGKRKAVADQDTGPSQLDIQRHRNVQQYNVSFNVDQDDDFLLIHVIQMQTRPLTLLEMHQQKKKKDRKTNGLTAEEDVTKRAFDREKDLVGHKRISKKDKDEFLRKSSELGSKFGYGRSSFL